MTSQDRDLLLSLRRQQEELQQSLARLNAQLGELEDRTAARVAASLPPLPLEAILPPIPPQGAHAASVPIFPPVATPFAALPPLPPPPRPSAEHHFGRGLIAISALFGVIVLAMVLQLHSVQALLGHAGILAVSGGASIILTIIGDRLARHGGASSFVGRVITALSLAGLYGTAYAACDSDSLRIFESPLAAGLVLVGCSLYLLWRAEHRKSQLLGVCGITLAYISTALNGVDAFTMGVNLLLAATAVVFLLRNGWAAVGTFGMIGAYLAALRRFVIDENGEFVLDTRSTLHFTPSALYLVIAWILFTAGALLTTAPTFRGGKRRAFITLNNGAVAGLLAMAAYVAGYGANAVGWTLVDTGIVFLFTSRFAEVAEIDPVDVMGAYAAQGLALVTGGIMIVCSGLRRAVLLAVETLLLGVAAAFSGDRILTISTHVTAVFATLFLLWEILFNAHHPWLLGFGGALVMFINAWACRGEVRNSPVARSTIVVSTSAYCLLGISLIFAALVAELAEDALPPALAFAALVLTFAIYYFAIFELPALAQILLVGALWLVIFPTETGEALPAHTTAWVTIVTLLLITWWGRQRMTRTRPWIVALTFLYAAALAALAHDIVRPYLDAPGWIVGASLLSFVFLVYGAFTRVWALAAMGQIFLLLAVRHLLFPPHHDVFPWAWWVAAVPIVILLATARATHEWLRLYREIPVTWSRPLKLLAYAYQLIALAAGIRWIFGIVPAADQVAALLFLGTLVLSLNVRHLNSFGVRCSFLISVTGMFLYLGSVPSQAHAMATALNAFAMLLLLAQTGFLRQEGRHLVTTPESWAHILLAAATTWVFVSAWAWTRLGPGYLTMSWGLEALGLFVFGVLVREPRLRWCGTGIILAAILRVMGHDLWNLHGFYRVLTFFTVAVIAFAIGVALLLKSNRQSK
jgi:hypothetical protein